MKRYTSLILIATVVGIVIAGALSVALPAAANVPHDDRGGDGGNAPDLEDFIHNPCEHKGSSVHNPLCK